MMLVAVLDYGGTLDRLPNPVGFVRALVAKGSYAIIYSGSNARTIEQHHPGLTTAASEFVLKGWGDTILDAIASQNPTEVYVADDDQAVAQSVLRAGRDKDPNVQWHYVPPRDLQRLLVQVTGADLFKQGVETASSG